MIARAMANSIRVAFLGGNGHCADRLAMVRRSLPPGIGLAEVPYPGFEDRPRAASLDDFLARIADYLRSSSPVLVYATGIGGLLALCLRARGELTGTPILLQAPVLWGLEHRWIPRMMRLGLAQAALRRVFATTAFQRRFVRKYFTHPPDPATIAVFFDGYARCAAAPDLFAWLTPSLLRSLEQDLTARPAALDRVTVWWGGRDRVVDLQELEWTKAALGLGERWPVRVFPDWGHYPQIDQPQAWARALADAVADAGAV
jgi:pimeloyl-ACP methyl ester carboxylesterase